MPGTTVESDIPELDSGNEVDADGVYVGTCDEVSEFDAGNNIEVSECDTGNNVEVSGCSIESEDPTIECDTGI